MYLASTLSFWSILGVLGNSARLCPLDVIFSARGSVFRAEHAQLARTGYSLSKTLDLRVRNTCSTLKVEARYLAEAAKIMIQNVA